MGNAAARRASRRRIPDNGSPRFSWIARVTLGMDKFPKSCFYATMEQEKILPMSSITLPLIIGTAVVDSINPCAFAVLIFLILYLMTVKDRKRMLIIGLVYVSIVYLAYFLAGLGLLSFIQSIHITKFFYNFTAVLSILLGLYALKEAFWHGHGLSLGIPESKKPLLQKFIKKATVPAAIVLGLLVAMFELPCTGGVYLAVLSLLADKNTWWQAFGYLLIYNFIFVFPQVNLGEHLVAKTIAHDK